jgi:hypothetical protein
VRLDPDDGALIARESTISASPAVDADDVVVMTVVETGTPARTVEVRDKSNLSSPAFTVILPGSLGEGAAVAPPAVRETDGRVFVADTSILSAFPLGGCGQPTCEPTWTVDLGAPLTTVVTVPGSSSVFTIRGNDLVAVSRTGLVEWTAPLGAAAPGLAVTGTTIYVAAGTTLQAYSVQDCGTATCPPLWTASLGAAATTSPVVAGGVVYVGREGGVEAVAVADHAPLATLPVAGPPDHLSVAGGQLYVIHRPTPTGLSRLTAFAPSP